MKDSQHVQNCTTTTIPHDLIIEILSLLPAKSLIRFQSVSKLWFSTIRSKTFVDLFLTRSKTCPRLLFTFYLNSSKENFLFSAPQYDSNNDDKSSSVLARYDMTISDRDYVYSSVNGFVCCVVSSKSVCNKITVYNPTTRQIIKLPDVTSDSRHVDALIGYDPVEDQYKVLCVTMYGYNRRQQKLMVCTVSSTQKQEWRKIENPTGDNSHYVYGGTCIDGALYYTVEQSRIAKFNLRSEKIEFIKTSKKCASLINYNGKLGRCSSNQKLLTLWVLEDVEKQQWSRTTYPFPYHRWTTGHEVYVVTNGGICPGFYGMFRLPFCVCYYDFNKKNIRKVEIRGMEDGDLRRIHGCDVQIAGNQGHIENIRFL